MKADSTNRDYSESEYEALLQLARQGDGQALGQLLEAEMGWLTGLVRGHLGLQASGVEDLVQECVLRCLKARGGGFGSGGMRSRSRAQFRGWLRSITFNLFKDRLRRARCVPIEAGGEDLEPAPRQRLGGSASTYRGDEMRAALGELPKRSAAALVLRDFCRCEYETVAWLLGSGSIPAARRMRDRALMALRANPRLQCHGPSAANGL